MSTWRVPAHFCRIRFRKLRFTGIPHTTLFERTIFMIERLETIEKKYNEINEELMNPEILSDIKKTLDKM